MLGLKLNHVSKRGYGCQVICIFSDAQPLNNFFGNFFGNRGRTLRIAPIRCVSPSTIKGIYSAWSCILFEVCQPKFPRSWIFYIFRHCQCQMLFCLLHITFIFDRYSPQLSYDNNWFKCNLFNPSMCICKANDLGTTGPSFATETSQLSMDTVTPNKTLNTARIWLQ